MLRRHKRFAAWIVVLVAVAAWVWLSSRRPPLGLRIEEVGIQEEGSFRSLTTLTLNGEGISFEYDWSAASDPEQAGLYGIWEHRTITSIRDHHWYWRSRNAVRPVFEFKRFDLSRWGTVTTGFRYPDTELRIGLPWFLILLAVATPIGFKSLLRLLNEPHGSNDSDACGACGYRMAGLSICPECNWQRPKTPIRPPD